MRKRIQLMPSRSVAVPDPVEPKYVGIWIDRAQAHLITVQGGIATVDSASTSETETDAGALAVKRFYRQIVERIGDAEELLIAGPADCREEFRREFIRHAPLSKRLAEVRFDDSPTPRQMRAKAKRFFEARQKQATSVSGTVIAV